MMDLKQFVADVENFPKEGILFRDITPLMSNGEAYKYATQLFVDFARECNADVIVGPEARGFIFGCPAAFELGIGFAPVRKPGKLPRETVELEYDLEYGSNTLCMHKDSILPGQRVVIIDDLLATGGTVEATVNLIEGLGGVVAGLGFLIELDDLNGREKLAGYNVMTVMNY